MKYITLVLVLVASNAVAQNRLSIHAGMHKADSIGFGLGAGLTYTWKINEFVSVGATASAIKFKRLNALYYPVVVHTAFHPVRLNKVIPLLFAEAGTGIYSDSKTWSATEKFEAKGGFTFFSGLGLRIDTRLQPTIMVGRSGFTTHSTWTGAGGSNVIKFPGRAWGIRLGISL